MYTVFKGFKIILTGDEGLVSSYYGTYLGFASSLPMDIFPAILGEFLFPIRSGKHGRMLTSQYGLCKIEATLLNSGFSRNEVAIVDPRRLEEAIGPETRAIGIGVLDPLGVNYGTALLRIVLRLMGMETRLQSYMSWATMKIFNNPAVKGYRNRLKIIVGGQGVWEIIDGGLQRKLGIDTIVEGEGELVAPTLFKAAVNGMPLPSYIRGPPVPVDRIPVIRTPSRGFVEITRGCGRGCMFCNPTLLMFRSIPYENISREILTNLIGNEKRITLHSEDFLRYGSTSLYPNEEKITKMLGNILKIPGLEEVTVDFVAASTVMLNPRLVKAASDILGIGGRNRSLIQMGIESASPRIIKLIAPGKPKPFSYEKWPEVVESAIIVLNDTGWWVCATIIVELPFEQHEDIESNIKMVEKLEHYDVLVLPLPFIPSGSLRRIKKFTSSHILTHARNLELIAIAVYDAVKKIRKLSKYLVARAPIGVKQLLGGLLYMAATIGVRKLQRGILEFKMQSYLNRYSL